MTKPRVTVSTDVVFLVGPTAAGKSEAAVELAALMDGEIVSADSMQVYRGLDILSAKPSAALRRRIRHHLIDILDPGERCDAALYARLARGAIAGILRRGLSVVVAGGAGMYVRALTDGIFDGAGRDVAVRGGLEREAAEKGLAALYERLASADPDAAQRIHPNDARRIVRALEVLRVSGQKPSELRTQWRKRPGAGEGGGACFSETLGCRYVMAGLRRGKDDLGRRIGERVERMFREGAVEEVRRLLGRGGAALDTIRQSLGIGEIEGFIEGRYGAAEARRLLEKETRAYAKRQHTWFRKETRIRWFDVAPDEPPRVTAERIARHLELIG